MKSILQRTTDDLRDILPSLVALESEMTRLGEALMAAWAKRGKALVAGNGGSAADAMHLAEELVVRFQKNRRALAAMALLDTTAVTCAGNDFGYDFVFSRQVEAFGNPGDVFIGFTTSGNSVNIIKAFEAAKQQGLVTAGFLGKDGGKAKSLCDIALLVPSPITARVQEGHKVLYHSLCEWVDQRVSQIPLLMSMRIAGIALTLVLSVQASAQDLDSIVIARDGKSDYSISIAPDASPTVKFAADEVAAYLKRMSGASLPIVTRGATDKRIVLARAPEHGGVSVIDEGPRISVTGGTDAEALSAAYRLLDQLGCRFLAPQFDHYRGQAEIVPRKNVVAVPHQRIDSKPKLAYRKLYIEEGISHDEANLKQLIEWMPKVGYNVLVCPMDYGNKGRVKWDNWREALTPELQKRGITIEVGGHGYENFLNADMNGGRHFAEHPEWFGADEKGSRRKAKNFVFCTSNADAVAFVTKNFLDYVAKRPEIQIFDFWPPDGAVWCACADCARLGEPPERQAKLISHVSREVAKVRPDLKMEAIAYSKLIPPPQRETIDRNVLIDFCPIGQNFEFTLDDPAGHGMREDGVTPRANKQYFDALQDWRKRFAGPISLYSYYRRYAWDSLPVMSPWHMKREMAWFASIPVQGISTYSEPGDWFTYELNHYVLPALAWDPEQDVDALVKKFVDARYGDAAPVALKAYTTLADVVRKYGSVPFVSLKSEAEIDAAAERVNGVAKEVAALRDATQDETLRRHLARLGSVVDYVQRDLAVQKMRAAKAPAAQIRDRIAKDHAWLSEHAGEGFVLLKGHRLNLNRAYSRYGVNEKAPTTSPGE